MREFIEHLERELRAAVMGRGGTEATGISRPSARRGVWLISLAAVSAAALLVAMQSHAQPATGRSLAADSAWSAQPVNPQIVASFRAFRRARTLSDALPPGLVFSICGGEGPGHYAWCDVTPPAPSSPSDQPAGAANQWRLVIDGHAHYLQVDQSRRLPLPEHLGSLWLLPSGGWLCAFLDAPRWRNYWTRMSCGTIGLILRRPPIDFPGYFFGPTAHGIMMAAEPDEVTRAVIAYPGGTEIAVLRRGVLAACVGQGPYKLEQTTADGARLKPIRVGAYGSFKPATCSILRMSTR